MERDHSEGEQALNVVRQFVTGIAHDLNNLLTEIVMSSDLALETLPGDHAVRNDILTSRHAAIRAAALTRQLLALVHESDGDKG